MPHLLILQHLPLCNNPYYLTTNTLSIKRLLHQNFKNVEMRDSVTHDEKFVSGHKCKARFMLLVPTDEDITFSEEEHSAVTHTADRPPSSETSKLLLHPT